MAKKKKKISKAAYTRLHESLNNQALDVYTYGGKQTKTPNGMPSNIKIRGRHFQILYHTAIYAEPKKTTRLRGIVMYASRIICIDPRQTIHMMRETLYHEMAHVYLNQWQSNGSPLVKLSPVQIEEMCDLFAEAHYDALMNAPAIRSEVDEELSLP